MQTVQLVNTAVDACFVLKNKSDSFFQLGPEALPWMAFFRVSVPKCALIVLGASYFA